MSATSGSLSITLIFLLSAGCRTASAPPSLAEAPIAEVPAPPSTTVPVSPPTAGMDVNALYAQCRERVEGPESDGECSSDADCRTGGCSGEVCTTLAAAEGLMGTCEVLPCFSILQECGCREGRCSWSIGEPKLQPGVQPIVLPPRSELPGATAPTAPE